MSVALLRDLASVPRPTGSEAIAAARERVTRELRALGFNVRDVPFEYSTLPGRFGTPLLGATMLLLVGVSGHLGAAGERWLPLVMILIGGLAAKYGAEWVGRRGVLTLPMMRARGVNLEATRSGGAPPAVWLCAHLDTKSQPIPTLIRILGLVVAALGYNVALVLAVVAAFGRSAPAAWWVAATLVTLVGAIPVMMSVITFQSPGALDNASGVAAVVAAARSLDGADVGVLITDAEELGLAGARAWATQPRNAAVLNCDGVDDGGDDVVVLGTRPGRIVAALPLGVRKRNRVPGVLTDSIAFADAGMSAVTFMRGGWASFARVHSARDDLAHLEGSGIADTGTLMAATARRMLDTGAR